MDSGSNHKDNNTSPFLSVPTTFSGAVEDSLVPQDSKAETQQKNHGTFPDKTNKFFANKLNFYIFGCLGLALTSLLLIGAVFLGFRYFVGKTTDTIKDTVPFAQSSEEEKTENSKFENPQKKDKEIIVGKVGWKIDLAQNKNITVPGAKDDPNYCSPAEGYTFVYVKYTIRNVDREFVTVPKAGADIFDREQVKYSPSGKTNKCLFGSDTSLLDKYAPDILKVEEKTVREELYEVKDNSKGLRIKAGDLSTVGSEFEYIELGF